MSAVHEASQAAIRFMVPFAMSPSPSAVVFAVEELKNLSQARNNRRNTATGPEKSLVSLGNTATEPESETSSPAQSDSFTQTGGCKGMHLANMQQLRGGGGYHLHT